MLLRDAKGGGLSMQITSAPIGIYDSGVGGLTVWLALKKLIRQDLLYYGDTAHIPYGDKSREQILFYSHNIIRFFQEKKARAVIAACNTSSALALPALQVSMGIPLFGVIEPAVANAIAQTRNNKVGIIATVGTVNSGSYQSIFSRDASDVEVFAQGCPKLVPLIEAGQVQGSAVDNALQEYIYPLLAAGIDTLVLGCTHYPFLLPAIVKLTGLNIKIVDPAWQTAKNVYEWLQKSSIPDKQETPMDQYWVSGSPNEFAQRARQFLGFSLDAVGHHVQPEAQPSELNVFKGELWSAWREDNNDQVEE